MFGLYIVSFALGIVVSTTILHSYKGNNLFVSILCGLSYLLVTYKYKLSLYTIEYLILITIMWIIALKDIKEMIIPDICVVLILVNKIVFSFIGLNYKQELITGIINGLSIGCIILLLSIITSKILGKPAMGGGDIKLIFALGTYVNIYKSFISILIGSSIALIYVLLKKEKNEFPFGPFICIGYYLVFVIKYFL